MQRQGACPSCGGPIELKLGASMACICPWCRHSIVRTDRALRDLGKVSDLVPTAPEMVAGDFGSVRGEEFVVGGRLQVDHGKGPWDEWYVELPRLRSWAWVAKAQGRYYFTSPVEASGLPPFDQMSPGSQGTIPGTGDLVWTVAERGGSALVSAEGELPFPAVPGDSGRYVDLEGPGGKFATIDYGDGSEPAKLFVGEIVAASDVLIRPGAAPRAVQQVAMGKLSCPGCGSPIELRAPDQTERATCPSCFALLDREAGNFKLLTQLSQPAVPPTIPLGTTGTLFGDELLCVGFMVRSTDVEGVRYTWNEYLLHTKEGFRWLMEDQGHFTFYVPISGSDVKVEAFGITHNKRWHRVFSRNTAVVRYVLGEFYWRVEVGETVQTTDYIAPPTIVSEERSGSESIWSGGRYVPPKEIWKAFGLPKSPPRTYGVAPAQTNPHGFLFYAIASVLGLAILGATAVATSTGRYHGVLVDGPLALPPGAGELPPGSYAVTTPPFTVPDGPTSLEIELQTSCDNQWVGVSSALLDEATGEVTDFYVDTGYFHGVEDGESWTEGSSSTTSYLGRVRAGTYVLQLEPRWESYPQPGAGPPPFTAPNASLRVSAGERSPACGCISALLLLVPLVLAIVRRKAFEAKRWENSSL